MCLHPCSQPTLSWSPREPWELPGTGSQMGRQRLPRASFGLVVMSGTSRRPVHLRASFPLFRSRSRGSRLWTISFFIAPGRRMKLTYSVDMGASLGPGGKVEGRGILTIWEPGTLGSDFKKPSRLTQRCTHARQAHSHRTRAYHRRTHILTFEQRPASPL